MSHLSEEDLIDLYYGEGSSAAKFHVQACRACSAQLTELRQTLETVSATNVPQRSADYGDRVWQALQPRLIPYEKKPAGRPLWVPWKAAALAVGCAMLLVAAFVGGRVWERRTKLPLVANANPQATQRVVLVVLTDHLDRTERLLVALQHADSSDATESALLQSEARELLASNRLYRATASKVGDPAVAAALDRLEGVLAEVANNPNLTDADLQRVRRDMNSNGILFEIRVLLARSPNQASGPNPAKGATI